MAPAPGTSSPSRSPSRRPQPAAAAPSAPSFSFKLARGKPSPAKNNAAAPSQTPSAPHSTLPQRRQLTATRLPDPNRMRLPTRRLSMAALGEPQPASSSSASAPVTAASLGGKLPMLASSNLGKRAKKDSSEDVENEATGARGTSTSRNPSPSVDEFGRRAASRSPTTARSPAASLSASSRRKPAVAASSIPLSPSSKALANKVARSGSNADVHASALPSHGIPRLRTNSTLSAIPRAATSSDLSPRRGQPATLGLQPRPRQRSSVTPASFVRPASRDGPASAAIGTMGPPSLPAFYGPTGGKTGEGNVTAPQSLSRPGSSSGMAPPKLVRRASDAGLRPRLSGETRGPNSSTTGQPASVPSTAEAGAEQSSNSSMPVPKASVKPRQSVVVAPLRRKAPNVSGPPNSFASQMPLSSSLVALQKNANVKARTAAWEAGTPSPPPAPYRHLIDEDDKAPSTPERASVPFADVTCFDTPVGGESEVLPELESPEMERAAPLPELKKGDEGQTTTPRESPAPLPPTVAALRRPGIVQPKHKALDTPEAKARGVRRLSGLRESATAGSRVGQPGQQQQQQQVGKASPLRKGLIRPEPAGKRGAAVAQLAASAAATGTAASSPLAKGKRSLLNPSHGATRVPSPSRLQQQQQQPTTTAHDDSAEEELLKSLRLMARKAGISIEKVQSMMAAENAAGGASSTSNSDERETMGPSEGKSGAPGGVAASQSWSTLPGGSADVSSTTQGNDDEERERHEGPSTDEALPRSSSSLVGEEEEEGDPAKRFTGAAFTARQTLSSLSVAADRTVELSQEQRDDDDDLDASLVMALSSTRPRRDESETGGRGEEEAKSSSGPDESFMSAPMSPVKLGLRSSRSVADQALPSREEDKPNVDNDALRLEPASTPSSSKKGGGVKSFRPRESVRLEDGLAALSSLRLSDEPPRSAARKGGPRQLLPEGEAKARRSMLLTEDDSLLEDLDEAVKDLGEIGFSPLPSMVELPIPKEQRRREREEEQRVEQDASSSAAATLAMEAEIRRLRSALDTETQRACKAEASKEFLVVTHAEQMAKAREGHEEEKLRLSLSHRASRERSRERSRGARTELGRALAEVAKGAAREAGGVVRGERLQVEIQADVASFLLAQCTVWERVVRAGLPHGEGEA